MSSTKPTLVQLLNESLVFFDGATGTYLQDLNLGEDDFEGLEGCNEVLVRTRPDVIREFHAAFFRAGVHCVETNSFGSSRIVLDEYGIADHAYDLNRRAAAIAREVAADFSTPDRPRYVGGSMGPTTKLPTLGHIGFEAMSHAFQEQARGLIDGGADFLIIETAQDILQVKAALFAVRREFERQGRRLPLMLSLTFETTGSMLLGTELPAALAALSGFRPDLLGLNCATGPAEMRRHIHYLREHSPFPISALPNAGLPENIGGRTVYPLSPEEFAAHQERFVREEGVRAVGGCCGTTVAHIAALIARLESITPAPRRPTPEPAVSSIYYAATLDQSPPPFLIGERTNANGSRAFRDLLLAEDFDGMVTLAKDQERGGAHALDVCVAYVGRDEARDMGEVVRRFAQQVRLPLVIDSTTPEVMELALRLAGGRCIVNSVNFEDGEPRARRVMALARDYGAALVALTIDETGMAIDRERKLAVARRLVDMATGEFGLAPEDVIIDALTFTVGSGDESLRGAAIETVEAIRLIKAQLPGVRTVLGVSNISFGLKPRARHILNSVFLKMAVDAGLDMAIVDAGKILPLNRIDAETRQLAEDLLYYRQTPDCPDPLLAYIRHFEQAPDANAPQQAEADLRPLPERIHRKVVDGDRSELELLLSTALLSHSPLSIINDMLIPAMKEVGELFGAGQMQLPFVLQAAEVMKQAVGFLEPVMEKSEGSRKGRLVLATVKGDVHDIGKNLVDILLSNNGYEIFNLGIKVPVEEMIRVYQEVGADAIGMSGLLVKSTVVMRENLEEFRRRGLNPPVLLGGAALTRRYVEEDLRAVYGPGVYYGQDAFDGLRLMAQIREGGPADTAAAPATDRSPGNLEAMRDEALAEALAFVREADGVEPVTAPAPPFLGTQVIDIPTGELFPLLNETALFRGRWQYRRSPEMSAAEFEAMLDRSARPALEQLKAEVLETGLFEAKAVYGYLPAYREGNALVLLDEDARQEKARFVFPRQRKAPYHCVASYFSDGTQGPDIFGFFVVTIGPKASLRCQELFESHRYLAYLQLHGLSVESAEAGAEYVHRRMREELGIAADDPADLRDLFKMEYRGARYSFGYPACPNLDDQFPLLELLGAPRIGVSLSESAQMHPEQSVSAFVVHHPAARYFNPLLG